MLLPASKNTSPRTKSRTHQSFTVLHRDLSNVSPRQTSWSIEALTKTIKLMRKLNVLAICEESQEICKAFRELGHNAWSCDLQECSGQHPEWHVKGDFFTNIKYVKGLGHTFVTMDGICHIIPDWDMIICFPPCTYLANTGSKYLNEDVYGQRAVERKQQRKEAIDFFMKIVGYCEVFTDHYAIENPLGCMSKEFREPDQIIQPWFWGDNVQKSTCLWTKGLPNLTPSIIERPAQDLVTYVDKNGAEKQMERFFYETRFLPTDKRRKQRSKTFPNVAKAIAEQWSQVLLSE